MKLLERGTIATYDAPVADLDALFEEARRHQRRRRTLLGLGAAGLIVFGLAVYGVVVGGAHPSSGAGLRGSGGLAASARPRVVALAIDVSGSMAATDLHPSRLAATVSGIKTFVRDMPAGTEIGLVVFSATTDVAVSPTINRAKLDAALGSLTPAGGTSLGVGLDAATQTVTAALGRSGLDRKLRGFVPGVVVLISDGGQNLGHVMPAAAAQTARKAGVRVYGIVIGAKNGNVLVGANRVPVPVPPDPTAVRSIGAVTRGVTLDASTANALDADLRQLARDLGR